MSGKSFVRLGENYINLDNVIEVYGYHVGDMSHARIVTTGVGYHYDDGGDYPMLSRTDIVPHTIDLDGMQAVVFMGMLEKHRTINPRIPNE